MGPPVIESLSDAEQKLFVPGISLTAAKSTSQRATLTGTTLTWRYDSGAPGYSLDVKAGTLADAGALKELIYIVAADATVGVFLIFHDESRRTAVKMSSETFAIHAQSTADVPGVVVSTVVLGTKGPDPLLSLHLLPKLRVWTAPETSGMPANSTLVHTQPRVVYGVGLYSLTWPLVFIGATVSPTQTTILLSPVTEPAFRPGIITMPRETEATRTIASETTFSIGPQQLRPARTTGALVIGSAQYDMVELVYMYTSSGWACAMVFCKQGADKGAIASYYALKLNARDFAIVAPLVPPIMTSTVVPPAGTAPPAGSWPNLRLTGVLSQADPTTFTVLNPTTPRAVWIGIAQTVVPPTQGCQPIANSLPFDDCKLSAGMIPDGSSCFFGCAPGYKLAGGIQSSASNPFSFMASVGSVSCARGVSTSAQSCVRIPTPAPCAVPGNATLTACASSNGKFAEGTCAFTCNEGYVMSGATQTGSVTCAGGTATTTQTCTLNPDSGCTDWSACTLGTLATTSERSACAATVAKCMPAGTGTTKLKYNALDVTLYAVAGTSALVGKSGGTWYVLQPTGTKATVFAASATAGTVVDAALVGDTWTVAPTECAALTSCLAGTGDMTTCVAAATACTASTASGETLQYNDATLALYVLGTARYAKEGPYVIQTVPDADKGRMLVVTGPKVVDVKLDKGVWSVADSGCTDWSACTLGTLATTSERSACAATVAKCMPAGTGTTKLKYNALDVTLYAVAGTSALVGKSGGTWYVLQPTGTKATVFAASATAGTVVDAALVGDTWTVAPTVTELECAALTSCLAGTGDMKTCVAAATACTASTASEETLQYNDATFALYVLGTARYAKEGPYVIQTVPDADGTAKKGKMLVVTGPKVVDVKLDKGVWSVAGPNWLLIGGIIGACAFVLLVLFVFIVSRESSEVKPTP